MISAYDTLADTRTTWWPGESGHVGESVFAPDPEGPGEDDGWLVNAVYYSVMLLAGAIGTGMFIAIPLLIAPVRVWLGYRSDAYPLRGLRREPYIILGAFLAGVGAALAVYLVLNTNALISETTNSARPACVVSSGVMTTPVSPMTSSPGSRASTSSRSPLVAHPPNTIARASMIEITKRRFFIR